MNVPTAIFERQIAALAHVRFSHELTLWRRCPERQLLGVDPPLEASPSTGEF
jgi:hypothetical protein